jgi:hypothetical protein
MRGRFSGARPLVSPTAGSDISLRRRAQILQPGFPDEVGGHATTQCQEGRPEPVVPAQCPHGLDIDDPRHSGVPPVNDLNF